MSIKYRSLTAFTAANPLIPTGGVVGVNKSKILKELQRASPQNVPDFTVISKETTQARRLSDALNFVSHCAQGYPVVVKPDDGQRGESVVIARNEDQLRGALLGTQHDIIVQKYARGEEFGVFFIKEPGKKGFIFSITHKVRPTVTGDGERSLEQLILDDERANLMARFLLDKHADELNTTPANGEKYRIVDLGTHCRGALFKDGNKYKTPALEEAVDKILDRSKGLYFGRFDICVPNIDQFMAGKNLQILEMNGVTSEATHIYDPDFSLIEGWKVLCQQWGHAFEVGMRNMELGAQTTPLREIINRRRAHVKSLQDIEQTTKIRLKNGHARYFLYSRSYFRGQ